MEMFDKLQNSYFVWLGTDGISNQVSHHVRPPWAHSDAGGRHENDQTREEEEAQTEAPEVLRRSWPGVLHHQHQCQCSRRQIRAPKPC
jgi:hypothetical protein